MPSGVSALADSSSQVTVKWTASTDNVRVASYQVKRNGTSIADAVPGTATSYVDTTVSAGTRLHLHGERGGCGEQPVGRFDCGVGHHPSSKSRPCRLHRLADQWVGAAGGAVHRHVHRQPDVAVVGLR